MKKLLNKLKPRKKRDVDMSPARITNDTVAEFREHILAGGRRFKYPLQYARHKLVFNTIIISLATLVILLALGWWQLYVVRSTSEFMYRVTRAIPVPVASIDGQPVLYSDYLMRYRSAIHYLENKEQVSLKTEDGKKQTEYIRQQEIKDAAADAYALKLAKTLGIFVSNEEVDLSLKLQREEGEISEQTQNAVVQDYYDWSPEEYRHITKNKLLRQKVAYAVDQDASDVVTKIQKDIKSGNSNLKEIADKYKVASHGSSGWLLKTNQDAGLTAAAAQLERSAITINPIQPTSGDGYYFIKLTDSDDDRVNYEYIHIPLKRFKADLDELINSGALKYYIDIEAA